MLRKLANGFTVIAEKPEARPGQMTGTIVLAVNENLDNYVTWWHRDDDGATFHGHYYPVIAHGSQVEALKAALEDFESRGGYY